ncbi:unnamed protein product, partial [Linum tenue]
QLHANKLNPKSALEPWRHLLLAGGEEQAEGDGDGEVDPEDVGLDDGAEAQCGLQVHQSFQHGAALARRRGPDHQVDQPSQKVGARPQLQRVLRALRRRRGSRLLGRGLAAGAVRGDGGGECGEEEEVGHEEDGGQLVANYGGHGGGCGECVEWVFFG